MKRLLFLVVFCVISGAAFAQRYIDTDSSFRVSHVRFDLTIPRVDTEYLQGSVRLQCLSRGIRAEDRIELRLWSKLTIDSIVGSQEEPLQYVHPDDTLYVTLPEPYAAGQTFNVTVFYHGFNRSGAFIHAYQVWPPDSGRERLTPPVEWTASEPFGSHLWWPCHDNPAEKIDSADFFISCAKNWTVAANGVLRSVTDHDTLHTFWWHEMYPIDHYLLAFSITNYDTIAWWHHWPDGDSMRIQNFVFPSSYDTMRSSLLLIDTLLDQYESWFGPYPFRKEKYGICQWHGGGMENQTLSFCNDADWSLLAHETAHQWFGDGITCKTWNDCWLNEGFATYVNDLYGRRYGDSLFNTWILGSEKYVTSFPGGAVHAQEGVLDTFPDDYTRGKRVLDGNLVYNKGALFLHMLNFVLGSDSAFFHAIRAYMTGPQRLGVASTEDLRASVERWSGKDLKWFFDEWIYDEGFPIYTLAWSQQDSAVSLAISQRVSSPRSPNVFRMPIELRFIGNTLDTIVTVWNDRSLQSYAFRFSEPLIGVQFDPHNYLIDGEAPRSLAVRTVTDSHNAFSLQRVAEDRYMFEFKDPTSHELSIYNMLGVVVSREPVAGGLGSIALDLRDLPSGPYFARFGKATLKFAIGH